MKATLFGAVSACMAASACSTTAPNTALIAALSGQPATTTFSRQVPLLPDPATVLPYALGVPAGPCPLGAASLHADGDRTILKVSAAPIQTVSYSVESDDPAFAVNDSTTIGAGMTGYEFSIPAPISKIRSISVVATGNDAELRSGCTAAPG